MKCLNTVALLLVIIGGLNWGLVGFARIDLVALVFGGETVPAARVVYGLVGLATLYSLTFLKGYFCCGKACAPKPPAN